MTRDEAKQLMRLELERDMSAEKRNKKLFPVGDKTLSANELMAEVDGDTELGKYLLDDFIAFKDGGAIYPDLTPEQQTEVIRLMQKDLDTAPAGWEHKVIYSARGNDWTPTKIMQEVRDQTAFGINFMKMYYANHRFLEAMFGKGYENQPLVPVPSTDETLSDLFVLPGNRKGSNDKSN